MEPLGIPGAWAVTPRIHTDARGSFHEWFRSSELTSVLGYRPDVSQANCSVSQRGAMRGVHFADVPPGQAKYVTCVTGAIMDVVVDVRVGSPTFSQWAALRLDTVWSAFAACLIMGVAVSGMHYTGMAALHIFSAPSGGMLGMGGGVGATSFLLPLILGISVLTFLVTAIVTLAPTAEEMREDAALMERINRLSEDLGDAPRPR